MQQLEVSLSIPIPAESVLISKVQLEEFKRQELTGMYWSMKDLEKRTSRGQVWLRENLLFPPQFKKELDSENGGCVFYPKAKGQNWSFQAVKMAEFLDKNFHRIFK